MEPLRPQSGIVILAVVTYLASIIGALGISHDLNNYLQLIELPTTSIRYSVAGAILLNGVACVSLERFVRWSLDRD